MMDESLPDRQPQPGDALTPEDAPREVTDQALAAGEVPSHDLVPSAGPSVDPAPRPASDGLPALEPGEVGPNELMGVTTLLALAIHGLVLLIACTLAGRHSVDLFESTGAGQVLSTTAVTRMSLGGQPPAPAPSLPPLATSPGQAPPGAPTGATRPVLASAPRLPQARQAPAAPQAQQPARPQAPRGVLATGQSSTIINLPAYRPASASSTSSGTGASASATAGPSAGAPGTGSAGHVEGGGNAGQVVAGDASPTGTGTELGTATGAPSAGPGVDAEGYNDHSAGWSNCFIMHEQGSLRRRMVELGKGVNLFKVPEPHSWEELCSSCEIPLELLQAQSYIDPQLVRFKHHCRNTSDAPQLVGFYGKASVLVDVDDSGHPSARLEWGSGNELANDTAVYIMETSHWLPALSYGAPKAETVKVEVWFTPVHTWTDGCCIELGLPRYP